MQEDDSSLRGALQRVAIGSPEGVALAAPDRPPLTFARLEQVVTATYQTLRSLGVRRNDRVALVLPNGPEAASAFVAIAAGATVAPLNPAYTAREYEFYLADLKPAVVVVQAGLDSDVRKVAAGLGIPIADLTYLPDSAAGDFSLSVTGTKSVGSSDGWAASDDVALVLHTSGTTARPKIVPLSHANITASARNIGDTLRLAPADVCLNVMPLFHIHGLIGVVLSSLVAGAGIVCPPGFVAPRFLDWVRAFDPTWYSAVPTIHQAVLERATERDRRGPTGFRFIRSSSAALPPSLMDRMEEAFDAPVIEAYGMTEASHQMASNPLPPGERKAGSVGRAAGPEIATMSASGELLGPDEIGEVVIRGPSVTAGYADNPEANRSAFSDGWFRTGDQGFLDDDGYLFLTGRIKELINRGGQKIAPREIDEVLLEHPRVKQAVAFSMPDPRLGEDVAAAVVLEGDLSELDLREFAAERLADHKVPRVIRFVEEIPKGPTGKLQRVGLAEKLGVAGAIAGERPEIVPPTSEMEAFVAEIWTEVLDVKPLGIHDRFLEVGGDSLLANQVIRRIHEELDLAVSIVALFDQPTIADQAHLLEEVLLAAEAETGDGDGARG